MLECSTKILPEGNSLAGLLVAATRSELARLISHIDIACPGQLKLLESFNRTDTSTISSAILRGALRSFFANSKARGKAYSPNSTLRRLFDDDLRQLKVVSPAEKVAVLLREPAFQMAIQGSL